MENELITTEMSVEPIVGTEPVATSEVPIEGTVDLTPDPAILKAEIERLGAVRKKAEEDARYWRQEKAKARGEFFKDKGREREVTPSPTEISGLGSPPIQGDFEDYDKFLDAKIAFETQKARIQWDRDLIKKQEETSYQQKIATLNEKINQGYQKYSDFEEVAMNETVPITPMVRDILADFDNPHDIAYYLGKNRMEAIQIARMTPIQATRAIAKIEVEIARLGNPTSGPPRIPSAPPPIKPVGSMGSIQKDPDKMTQREFEEYRKAQGARRF